MVNGKVICCSKSRLGACSAKVHVFSDTVFCTGPGALDLISASQIVEQKAEAVMKSGKRKKQKRHCRSVDWHCMARVLVTHLCKYCTSYKNSCRRPGTHLRFFQTGSSPRACSMTSPTWKARRCKTNVQLKRMKWPLTQQDPDPGKRCFCGPGSEETWKDSEERPSHQFADGERDKLYLRMISKLITSKQCSSIDEAKQSRRSWIACQKRTRQSSHVREYSLRAIICFCFAVKNSVH